MKTLLSITSIVILATFCSCSDQVAGHIKSNIQNDTQYEVQIHYYKNGAENTMASVALPPNETQNVASSTAEEAAIYPVYVSSVGYDSLVVTFESKKAVHYNSNKSGNNPFAIEYDDDRNLFNLSIWEKDVLKDTRRHYEASYLYTFTEQDYLKAR